jgi:hypothetical protein
VKSLIPNPDWQPWRVFGSLAEISSIEPGNFEVHTEGFAFGCEFVPSNVASRLIVVLYPGSPYPRFYDLPAREGCHQLRISDPSALLTDVGLSCYIGTERQDPVRGILQITNRVRECLTIAAGQVIYFGMSGGGFAALMCAIHDTKAIGVGLNPQVQLAPFGGNPAFERLARAFRKDATIRQLAEDYPERFSVIEALKAAHRSGASPRLFLSTNRDGEWDIKHQHEPFCRAFGIPVQGGADISEDLEVTTFFEEGGHNAFFGTRDVLGEAVRSLSSASQVEA